jgi:hypothetical protein
MTDGWRDRRMQAESGRGDQNDNLEGSIASDTVNTEVKSDSFRCVFLCIAG